MGVRQNEMFMPDGDCISSGIYGGKIFNELAMAFTAGSFWITL